MNLITALRHERIELDLVNRRAVTAAAPATFSRSYHPTTGRLGVVWDIAPGANLYAQASNAADPPSGSLDSASFADVRNNSELTTGRQVEVGSKFDFWDGKGSATVAAFEIRRKNIASQDPSNPNLTVLVGEQSSKGIELSAGIRPTPQWQLQGNLSLVVRGTKTLCRAASHARATCRNWCRSRWPTCGPRTQSRRPSQPAQACAMWARCMPMPPTRNTGPPTRCWTWA